MPAIPRIARVVPHGTVTRPETGIPVIARLRWANGQDVDVAAVALAWTQDAVEIRWLNHDESRTDWISATDVRRNLDEPVRGEDRPPSSRGRPRRNTW